MAKKSPLETYFPPVHCYTTQELEFRIGCLEGQIYSLQRLAEHQHQGLVAQRDQINMLVHTTANLSAQICALQSADAAAAKILSEMKKK